MTSITRRGTFEIAHNLAPYDGACRNLHGHRYEVEVTVTGPQDQLGFIVDFKYLKKAMNAIIPDHAYMYDANTDDELTLDLVKVLKKHGCRIEAYEEQTSCENNARTWGLAIEDYLHGEFDLDVTVSRVKVYETENSFAEWVK